MYLSKLHSGTFLTLLILLTCCIQLIHRFSLTLTRVFTFLAADVKDNLSSTSLSPKKGRTSAWLCDPFSWFRHRTISQHETIASVSPIFPLVKIWIVMQNNWQQICITPWNCPQSTTVPAKNTCGHIQNRKDKCAFHAYCENNPKVKKNNEMNHWV